MRLTATRVLYAPAAQKDLYLRHFLAQDNPVPDH